MSAKPSKTSPSQPPPDVDASTIAAVEASGKKDAKKAAGSPRKIAKKVEPGKAGAKGKKEEEIEKVMTPQQKKRLTVLGVSIVFALVFVIIGLAGVEIALGKIVLDTMAFIMLGLMILFGPFSIYEGARVNRIVKIEERLGDFLRDLSESSRAGMTLHEAIRASSKGDYGELSPEIKTMSIQISWGVSASEALTRFGERVNTPLVNRAVILINEAGAAGGDVSKVLEAAANDTKEIQLLQQERKIQMQMYIAIVFVAFLVFLIVIMIIYLTFVPRMSEMAEDFRETEEQEGGGGGAVSVFNPQDVDFDEIKFIYLMAGLVQGIGDGLVAGLMGSGRLSDGLKYSFLMILVVFMIFVVMFPLMGI
ncbi:MAG: type II secretion system F family protein [Thermoplasmata archaeon]|nr:MAG: type II secretion system F family protein [Thermoplasmata archaeon]